MTRSRTNSAKFSDLVDTNTLANVLNNAKTGEPQSIRAIRSLENELESNRARYLNTWTESASKLQSQLKTLKLEIRNDFTMQLKDVKYYRANMFQMEAKISKFKELIKNELCLLLKEESELSKDLQLTEKRVEDWGKPLNLKIMRPLINSICKLQNTELERGSSDEFQKFVLSSGGHYGNWEEQDHLLFLRERQKYNGNSKFISAVHSIIPDLSIEAIEEHENWFKKYEELKLEHKEAIKKWRESKSLAIEFSKTSEKKEISTKTKIKNTIYHRDITERIKEWKRQQQLKKAEEEKRKKIEQQNLLEQSQRKKELQKAKKLAVEQYKAEKRVRIQKELIAAQKIRELQAIEEKARKNILLKAFREQDLQYVQRIKSLRTQSAAKAKGKFETLENVKPAFQITTERDPRRLLQSTQVWNQHCVKVENQTDKTQKIIDLETIQHLAIPSWRKGLSNI